MKTLEIDFHKKRGDKIFSITLDLSILTELAKYDLDYRAGTVLHEDIMSNGVGVEAIHEHPVIRDPKGIVYDMGFVVSYGVVQHTDYDEEPNSLLIPLTGRRYSLGWDMRCGKIMDVNLKKFKPALFNSERRHSLAPITKPSGPFIGALFNLACVNDVDHLETFHRIGKEG